MLASSPVGKARLEETDHEDPLTWSQLLPGDTNEDSLD